MFTIEQFVAAKKVGAPHTGSRAGSAKTLEAYGDALRRAERLAGKKLGRFVAADAERVLRGAEAYAPSTRNQMVVALRQAFGWAIRTGRYEGENPFAHVGRAQVEDRLPRALPMDAVEAILAEVQRLGGREGAKYRLAFQVQATSGLRLGEVLSLRASNLGERGLTVMGKGNKRRYVPLRPDVLAALRGQVAGLAGDPLVFRGRFPDRPMDQSPYSRLFKRAVAAAGFDADVVTPHALRHSFATHALRETGRLEVVQDLLGHSDPKTTRVYARLLNEDLDAAFGAIWK